MTTDPHAGTRPSLRVPERAVNSAYSRSTNTARRLSEKSCKPPFDFVYTLRSETKELDLPGMVSAQKYIFSG